MTNLEDASKPIVAGNNSFTKYDPIGVDLKLKALEPFITFSGWKMSFFADHFIGQATIFLVFVARNGTPVRRAMYTKRKIPMIEVVATQTYEVLKIQEQKLRRDLLEDLRYILSNRQEIEGRPGRFMFIRRATKAGKDLYAKRVYADPAYYPVINKERSKKDE